jgi:hypothetical protein
VTTEFRLQKETGIPARHSHERSTVDGDSRDAPGSFSQRSLNTEPFVDADAAAEFLFVKRKTILDWARSDAIPAHPYGRGRRVVWRFRLSEIANHRKPDQGTIESGSPEMARPEKRYGKNSGQGLV